MREKEGETSSRNSFCYYRLVSSVCVINGSARTMKDGQERVRGHRDSYHSGGVRFPDLDENELVSIKEQTDILENQHFTTVIIGYIFFFSVCVCFFPTSFTLFIHTHTTQTA